MFAEFYPTPPEKDEEKTTEKVKDEEEKVAKETEKEREEKDQQQEEQREVKDEVEEQGEEEEERYVQPQWDLSMETLKEVCKPPFQCLKELNLEKSSCKLW